MQQAKADVDKAKRKLETQLTEEKARHADANRVIESQTGKIVALQKECEAFQEKLDGLESQQSSDKKVSSKLEADLNETVQLLELETKSKLDLQSKLELCTFFLVLLAILLRGNLTETKPTPSISVFILSLDTRVHDCFLFC